MHDAAGRSPQRSASPQLSCFLTSTFTVTPIGACKQCPQPGPLSQVWVILSALGTAAAGLGALVSGIAAILAVRAAAAAQNITAARVKERNTTAAPLKKSSGKRKAKR